MANHPQDYKTMMQELELLLNEMQVENLDIDDVIAKYEHGQKLLVQLKKHLETAESKIMQHKLPNNKIG